MPYDKSKLQQLSIRLPLNVLREKNPQLKGRSLNNAIVQLLEEILENRGNGDCEQPKKETKIS